VNISNGNSRLGARLATTGLASGFASSHFDGFFGFERVGSKWIVGGRKVDG